MLKNYIKIAIRNLRRNKIYSTISVLGLAIGITRATLLTTDFVKLVAIAFIIAVPVGWIVMNSWLNNFAYHTHLSASVFLGAGILALLLSIMTISWQAVRAALTNSVESLRSE